MKSNKIHLRFPPPGNHTKSNYELSSSPMIVTVQHDTGALQSWQNILPWQRDNKFILSHYRPASYSYFRSIISLSRLHNQSVNIYSHLVGTTFFIGYSCWFHRELATRYITASKTDIFVIDCFFLGAILCLGFSTTFHTLANHSAGIYQTWLLFDMIGILCLTIGSFFPGVYYGFYCEPEFIRRYWTMVRARDQY